MCFYIDYDHEEMKIAKKDILCYKTVYKTNDKDVFKSYWQEFRYKLGKTYKSRLTFGWNRNRIEDGRHSYRTRQQARDEKDKDNVILKCIIPANSKYYYNQEYKEYVSNRIKILERIS